MAIFVLIIGSALIYNSIGARVGPTASEQRKPFATQTYGVPNDELNHDVESSTAHLPKQLKHGDIKTKSLAGYIPSQKATAKGNDDVICVMCEYVMKDLLETISNSSTQEEIEKALEDVCNVMPETVREMCTQFIKTYAQQILAILVAGLDPKTVCSRMRLCPPQRAFITNKINSAHLVNRFADMAEVGGGRAQTEKHDHKTKHLIFQSNGKRQVHAPAKSNQRPEDMLCVSCLYIMDELSKVLKPNSTREEVAAAVNKVCDSVPTAVKGGCRRFVQRFSTVMVSTLVSNMTFNTACTRMHMCTGDTHGHHVFLRNGKQQVHAPDKSNQRPGEIQCISCLYTIDELSKVLMPDSTEEDITEAVNKMCDSVPTTLKGQCNKCISKFSSRIASTLVADMTFNTACVRMNLCEGSKLLDPDGNRDPDVTHHLSPGNRLKACFQFVKMVNEHATNYKAADRMHSGLAALCRRTNGLTQNECLVISDRYVSMMAKREKYLGIEPEVVCAPTN